MLGARGLVPSRLSLSCCRKFVSMCAATNLSALGLRAPSLCEAEAADAELCRQLNSLLSAGYCLDTAIHETVCAQYPALPAAAAALGQPERQEQRPCSTLRSQYKRQLQGRQRQGRWQVVGQEERMLSCVPSWQVQQRRGVQVLARLRKLWQHGARAPRLPYSGLGTAPCLRRGSWR